MHFSLDEIQVLPRILSAPRFSTYLTEKGGDLETALALYRWNMELSAAFLVPLQIAEVTVRNAIVVAIEHTYGPNWPWQKGFEISLRNPTVGYSPRRDLIETASKVATSGKVVAELKFIFWEKMFTSSHDGAIWNPYLRLAFAHAPATRTVQQLRSEGFALLQCIRDIRNRIAHHEPIFRRDIAEEYGRMRKIIAWVDPVAAGWVDKVQQVMSFAATKP